jgi:hypothetical protein
MTNHPAALAKTALFKWCAMASIFTGAFLLFLIQPLVCKAVIPWFGGTAATWSVIVLFFQLILLAGYLLAFLVSKLNPRRQHCAYAALALVALAFNQIKPEIDPSFQIGQLPQLTLLVLLLKTVGFPCLFLSTVSTTMQNWWALYADSDPYPLYGLSNAGSLLALLSFPIWIEPAFALSQVFIGWRLILLVLALTCLLTVFFALQLKNRPATHNEDDQKAPSMVQSPFLWLWLPLLTCALLLSLTEHLCHDIAPIPLLWILPLAVYLLSYIVAFNDSYNINYGVLAGLAVLFCGVYLALPYIDSVGLVSSIIITLIAFFFLCLWAHSLLFAVRPSAHSLPYFYFFTALGGAAGGMTVSLLAPYVFNDYRERWFALGLLVLTAGIAQVWLKRAQKPLGILARLSAVPVSILATYCIYLGVFISDKSFYKVRNFYGVLKVLDRGSYIALMHGTTIHGAQRKKDDGKLTPSTYYHPNSGVGIAMNKLMAEKNGPLKIGVVGLGTGSMAGYGRAGDTYVFYEINPAVVDIARNWFHFISKSPATIEFVMGDGRLSLQNSAPRQFDLLLIDAFSSDSIPAHLLTLEAMQIYLKHLAPNGFLLLHLSNRYLQLEKLAVSLARENQLHGCVLFAPGTRDNYFLSSTYAIMSRQPLDFKIPERVSIEPFDLFYTVPAWTDDRNNLFELLKNSAR